MSTYAFRLTEPTSAEVWTKLTEALSAAGIKLNVGAELIVANDEAASGKATSALKEAGLAYSEVTLSRRSLSIPEMDCPIEERDIQKVLDERKIADVELNVMTRTANFSGDERFVETVIDAVKAAGYEAKRPDTSAVTRHTLAIPEMDCPVEEQDIRKELDRHGIDGVELNVMSRTAVFQGNEEKRDAVIAAVVAAGYQARIIAHRTQAVEDVKIPYLRFGVALLIAFLSEGLDIIEEYQVDVLPLSGETIAILSLVLAVVAILMAGLGTLKEGIKCLFRWEFNMMTLMAVAVIGAVLIGAWPEAAMVMVLFEISETIEDLCMTKARRSIRDLMAFTPSSAQLVTLAGTETVPVSEIAPGAVIRVSPGDRFPLDGKILVGSTTTDQANVTGESLPVDKGPGDNVWSGTVNLTSTVDVTVTAAEADSLTARIIEAVENAQAAKSPVQRFVDKFAAIYTPIVFVVAIAAAIIPPFIWGDWMGWLYKAFCLLVIACPCALVISTPVTIASALGTATRCGLLIKGGLYLEQARQLKYVALDKTGTLTRGEPMVVEAQTLDTVTFDKALEIAASLAKMNKHPLSEAIVRFAHEKGIQVHEVSDFTALPGQGVRGHVHGNTYSLLKPSAVPNEDVQRLTEGFQKQGMSSVVLTDILGAQMIFGFADEMKANIQNDITQLKSVGLTPVLLTGDNREAAEHLAASVGITDVRANLLPEDKLNAIESFQKEGVTAMVGDGINDAPALARSDIGVAMGIRGTDSAIEAAHVAVMDDNIGSIATLVRLSKITHAVLVQNIAFALIIKLVFVLMALAGVATMWMAVFADTGTGLIVVANGMRMLRMKPRLDAQAAAAVKA
ncbi:MAG: heavy metal translocating P-type ATPase [Sutterella wadsworthensis]|nr:heavy metal translocating P-type ATPase [Sutterella wadsworthensis]